MGGRAWLVRDQLDQFSTGPGGESQEAPEARLREINAFPGILVSGTAIAP